MLSFITGSIENIHNNSIIVNNNGMGYRIFLSERAIQKLVELKQEKVKVFTHMSIKDDIVSLFGFLTIDDLEIFEKLITVSGVGPKSALSLLDSVSASDIVTAIITEDIKTLSLAKGIGKKTVQRIILELKDKVSLKDTLTILENDFVSSVSSENVSEAIQVLSALGFSNKEVITTINLLEDTSLPTDKLVNLCLKILGKVN